LTLILYLTAGKYHHGDLKNALIGAGVKILSKEGIHRSCLRKASQNRGIGAVIPAHSHFAVKQALIASLSMEGFRSLFVSYGSVQI
jgi:hypothetical protein